MWFALLLLSVGGVEEDNLSQLLTVKRVFVDRLGGGETANQVRDMLIASLLATKLFAITENQERADAFLRGSAEDLVFTDTFQSSESLNGSVRIGSNNTSSAKTSTSTLRSPGITTSIGENESSHTAERKHEATAAVRLVKKDGDVIWSTTQESLGAKFRGASADVADKVARQLLADFERARKSASISKPAPASGATSPR